jgi:protein-tyrosine phosphatase
MISQISDTNLFIGNASDAKSEPHLKQYGIQDIVNVAKDLNDPFLHSYRYFKVGLDDGSSNRTEEYVLAAKLVLDLLSQGRRVLLHCHEGKSRSTAVAILVIGEIKDLLPGEAYDVVVQSRHVCCGMKRSHWEHISAAACSI